MILGREPVPGQHVHESGSAVVYLIAGVALLIFALAAAAAVARIAQARAATALVADLSALAGADAARSSWSQDAGTAVSSGATGPCRWAAQVAEGNGAELARCQVQGWDVQVQVRTRVGVLSGPLGGPGMTIGTTADSRAGPVDP